MYYGGNAYTNRKFMQLTGVFESWPQDPCADFIKMNVEHQYANLRLPHR